MLAAGAADDNVGILSCTLLDGSFRGSKDGGGEEEDGNK